MKKSPLSTAMILLYAGTAALWINKGMELATTGNIKRGIITFILGITLNVIAAYDIHSLD